LTSVTTPSVERASVSFLRPEVVGVLDSLDVPVVVGGSDCRVISFNRAATETLGLAPSEIGARLGEIRALATFEDDIEGLCAQVMADEKPVRRDVRLEDRRFLLRIAPYAEPDGSIRGTVLSFTNVTAFRASLEQAIYEREYTKAILNTVPSPLVVLDSELRVQSGNRAFYATFAASREAAQGVRLSDLGDADWRGAGLWASLKEVLASGRGASGLEVERVFPAIGPRTLLVDAHAVLQDGASTILVSIQDITKLKRSEGRLQEADRKKDEFLALLSHELRNPLMPIRTALELLRLSGDTPQSVRRVRLMMERQVSHMVRLIDDLLDVSRITTGKIALRRDKWSLAGLIESAVESQQSAIDEADLELRLDLPSDECVVEVDGDRFVQILSNVLHNAWKFTKAGGQIRCVVERRVLGAVHEAVITISDTGIGISEEMLPRVFEMFTQSEPATQRSHGGLGVGLALARRLAQMHGGDITARSDGPGRGSAFAITVPVCDTPVTGPSPPRFDSPMIASRVVVIDDNRDGADAMCMLVEQLGGTVRVAYDATSGLEVVEGFQPNIVFLDIGMPRMDGYEVCRRIRRKDSHNSPLIVAITGWGQDRDKEKAVEAGFDAHLTKPVEADVLARLLAGAPQHRGL
jgi:signal transduction histidine kinase